MPYLTNGHLRETKRIRIKTHDYFRPYSSSNGVHLLEGNYGRSELERCKGLNKNKGYICSSESVMIDRLMEILSFFDDWQNRLELKIGELGGDGGAWKTHFITCESWCDLRLCVLGFVGMCRYLHADTQRFKIGQLSPGHRYFSPRTCSQVGTLEGARWTKNIRT